MSALIRCISSDFQDHGAAGEIPQAFIRRASSFRQGHSATTVLAFRLDPAMLADGGPAAVLASRLLAAVLAEGGPAAVLA